MKTDVSMHLCVFCPATAGADEKHALTYPNATRQEVELVVNGKYILTFPAMILHYLNKGDSALHGWKNPWKPPMWFVHTILGSGTIAFPPTAEQLRTLPNYRLGYLTTQKGIESCGTWMGQPPPAAYGLDPKSTTKDVVIDTMGGDENFTRGAPAEFGDIGNAIQTDLMARLKFLIGAAVEQSASPSALPTLGTVKNATGQWVAQVAQCQSLGTTALTPPPPKTPDKISFGNFVRAMVYIPYANTNKPPESRNYVTLISPSSPEALENNRKILFGWTRYHVVSDLVWQIKNDKAEAFFNFKAQDENYFMKYDEWPFEKWKNMLLEVFQQLKIDVVEITKDKVVVKLASLKAIEAQHVNIFPLAINVAAEPLSPVSTASSVSFFGQPSPSSSAGTPAPATPMSASPISAQPQTNQAQQAAAPPATPKSSSN